MKSKWTLELISWGITLVLLVLILLPIYTSIGGDYLFYIENIVSIVIFTTFTRWIFLLRHTFFGWDKKVKTILIFLMIPLFFICYDNIIDFQAYIDENDIMSMLSSLSTAEMPKMAKYIQYQYIFFGVGAIICVVIMPFRMILSIWRQINRGTV